MRNGIWRLVSLFCAMVVGAMLIVPANAQNEGGVRVPTWEEFAALEARVDQLEVVTTPTTTTTVPPTTTTTVAPTTTTTAPNGGWTLTRAWYDANTGPSGSLTVHNGSLTTSADGQVIENLHIKGELIINHNNVTVRNCKVDGDPLKTNRVTVKAGKTGFVLDHCEVGYTGAPILSNGVAGSDAVSRGYLIKNTKIHRSNDGLKLGQGGRIEYSLIITDEITEGAHADGVQMMDGSGQRVYRNWFVSGTDGTGSGFNATVWISENMGPIDNVVVEGNHFSGSGFQVKVGSAQVNGVTAKDNVHTPNYTFGPYKDYGNYLTVVNGKHDDGSAATE